MIIVKLKGGLGNQLFQYAAAKNIAEKLNSDLKFDISFLTADAHDRTKRDFELDKFQIDAEVATPNEVSDILEKKWTNFLRPKNIRERYFTFLKPLLKSKNDYYINGYWQSEKYFRDIDSIIRKELVFKKPLEGDYFDSIIKKINSTNSISIHFRRGDYVTDKKTNQHHGVCSLEYYQEAVEILSKKVESPVFFVFSDDITWVKANFTTEFPMIFIENSDENSHSDFRLMSVCKHNIIANSSYSWWAAWLNSNKEKIVVAPKKWYASSRKQRQAADRVPKEWMRI